MFKNQGYVSHLIGSAAVGAAVGMVVQKILSPRSTQKSETNTDSKIRYEYVQENSRANSLQVPSHCHKHRRHHSRSKSASRAKHARKESGCLSISENSLRNSQLSASESDLRSRLENDCDVSKKRYHEQVKRKKTSDTRDYRDNDSRDKDEFIANTFTEYLPLKRKKSIKSNVMIETNYNSDIIRESIESNSTEFLPFKLEAENNLSDKTVNCNFNSLGKNFTDNSTEYMPFKFEFENKFCDKSNANDSTQYLPIKVKNNSKAFEPVSLLFDVNSRKTKAKDCNFTSSIDNHADTSNYSIIATCDTLDKDNNFDSYCEEHGDIIAGLESFSI